DGRMRRAAALLEMGRHDMAERELRALIGAFPEHGPAHALLASSLSAQHRGGEALQAAEEVVRLAPHDAFCHYVMADVLDDLDRGGQAMRHAMEAVRLDPTDADYRAMLAHLHCGRGEWKEALEAAEEGLRLNPRHAGCLNLRGLVLAKLGRHDGAIGSAEESLAIAPQNAASHATRGITLLEAGRHEEALESFREALRLDPMNDAAREGVVVCLKARSVFYRVMLRYFLWMSRMSARVRLGLIIGLYLLFRLLGSISRENPAVGSFVWPLMVAYIVFVFLSWAAEPLTNLLLRLNRFGRLLLSRRQIIASNVVGGLLLISASSLAASLAADSTAAFVFGIICCLMIIPTSAAFGAASARGRAVLGTCAVGLGVIGLLATVAIAMGWSIAPGHISAFGIGLLTFTLIANFF
ncbi:MAG: tetratricopeptide repeat protein, partial [Planctomycetota bacterium]|nr:tetratricopeptide repeat protein [Planctomycetota bacterium]